MTNIPHTYREMTISSALMEVPREAYQRNFNVNRAKKIAEEFDERIANEPKVSFRDGRYFVFDGQHTVAARKFLNGGEDLPIKCKVYFDMTEQEEALCLGVVGLDVVDSCNRGGVHLLASSLDTQLRQLCEVVRDTCRRVVCEERVVQTHLLNTAQETLCVGE